MHPITRMAMVMISLQLALGGSVWAFAVGEISVQSRRGEPFAAQIRLLLNARERDKDVIVTLGGQDDYRAEGLKRPALIDTLRAVVSGTRESIRLSSSVALQDAAFDLVLSVRAGQVTIVKHYRVAVPAPAPTAAQPPVAFPTTAQLTSVVPTPKPAFKPSRIPRRTRRYGPVERGETLYSVVMRGLHTPSDQLWQTAVVLWKANKAQFHGGNLHGLPVGSFLEIPADLAEQTAGIRLQDAQELVAAQWDEWQTVQRAGVGKQRAVTAARAAATPEAESPEPVSATEQPVTPPPAAAPADKAPEPASPSQAMVLPVGKPGSMVNMEELQTALQGLEERLLRRMPPTTPGQPPEIKAPSALVSALDLQASIQNLEERLTQRMQHMLTQASEPVQVGQRVIQTTPGGGSAPPVTETTQSLLLVLLPYVIVLTNVLLLLLGAGLVWFWLRRRDRAERMQRI